MELTTYITLSKLDRGSPIWYSHMDKVLDSRWTYDTTTDKDNFVGHFWFHTMLIDD